MQVVFAVGIERNVWRYARVRKTTELCSKHT
jgi:hypothetical protein